MYMYVLSCINNLRIEFGKAVLQHLKQALQKEQYSAIEQLSIACVAGRINHTQLLLLSLFRLPSFQKNGD